MTNARKMKCNNPNLTRIQNLVKFYQFVLKILSGNENLTDRGMDERNDGQPKSSIAPLFQSRAINTVFNIHSNKFYVKLGKVNGSMQGRQQNLWIIFLRVCIDPLTTRVLIFRERNSLCKRYSRIHGCWDNMASIKGKTCDRTCMTSDNLTAKVWYSAVHSYCCIMGARHSEEDCISKHKQ